MLSDRALTRSAAASRGYSKEELVARERVRLKVEQEEKKQHVLRQ